MLTINRELNVDLIRFHLFSFFSILYIYAVSKINSKYPKTTAIITILLTLPVF